MDERTARDALRAMSGRMPGADVAALAAPVTSAWNTHADGTPLQAGAVCAVVDVAWAPGYAAGVTHGHAFVADHFARAAQRLLDETGDAPDPQGARVLRAVGGTAAAVGKSTPTVTDPGPSHNDYVTATGDFTGETDAERAAAGARVGWTHGYRSGDADAAWAAAGRIIATVGDLLGEDTMRRSTVAGVTGKDWLSQLDVTSREDSAADVARRPSGPGRAFRPLRAIRTITAGPTSPADLGTSPPQQSLGRRR